MYDCRLFDMHAGLMGGNGNATEIEEVVVVAVVVVVVLISSNVACMFLDVQALIFHPKIATMTLIRATHRQ